MISIIILRQAACLYEGLLYIYIYKYIYIIYTSKMFSGGSNKEIPERIRKIINTIQIVNTPI